MKLIKDRIEYRKQIISTSVWSNREERSGYPIIWYDIMNDGTLYADYYSANFEAYFPIMQLVNK